MVKLFFLWYKSIRFLGGAFPFFDCIVIEAVVGLRCI